MNQIKNLFINIILILASLILLLVFLEFIVFRFILFPSEFPKLDFVNGVIKYTPNQTGVFRVKNEVAAKYRVNANGWNSGHDNYTLKKNSDKYRIAVIGDSYVEAHVLDFDVSLSEKLESKLGNNKFEVYRFGISGAPMSQYLHMLRNEVMKYEPDLVIVILVHNDFDESYEFLQGSYASNFMKLKIENGDVIEEEPKQFVRPWYSSLRESAIWRYLVFRQKIPIDYIKDILLGNKIYYQGNISITAINAKKTSNEIVTNYVFSEMKELCDNNNAELLIVMGGVTEVVYGMVDKVESVKAGALSLNLIAKEAARQNGIDFLDLEPVFEDYYKQKQKRLTFIHDGHWNEFGHEIAANAIYEYMNKQDTFEKK
ncbi:MAG: SGNH/GDSL hydrolase family protein [Thermodesulfovibrionia bacterium]|nr:SGNH/GDSL hydrolase family protein [Thermodesulfovibrionia bacterium]